MAAIRDPRVAISQAYATTKRRLRRPVHRFRVDFKPWQLQPCAIAPVLPGETLKHVLLQARAVSMPLHNLMRLQGWWLEYWIFYVKHRDNTATGGIRQMMQDFMINPAVNLDSIKNVAAVPAFYSFQGGVPWLEYGYQRIVEEYFREEGENWDHALIDGLAQLSVWGRGHNSWTDGLTLNPQKRSDYSDVGLDDADDPSDFEEKWAHWAALRESGLVQMDYEDFIRTYGETNVREEETSPNLHRPELIKYYRQWAYPVNVVEPTTGVPATAVSFSVADRADKQFRFTEPGFLIALMTARPKPYEYRQAGYAAGMLDTPASWLPALTHDHYELAYKSFASTTGPWTIATSGGVNYWVDTRDLYMHGDQFVKTISASAPIIGQDVPAANGNRRYASATDIDSMFVGSTDAGKCFMVDGTINLAIAGRQSDRTPGAPI